jgi:hypothetical protein
MLLHFQSKTKAKTETNTPNNRQTTNKQKRHCEQGQLSRRKVDVYASQQSYQYGVKIQSKYSKETITSPYRKTSEGTNKTMSGKSPKRAKFADTGFKLLEETFWLMTP